MFVIAGQRGRNLNNLKNIKHSLQDTYPDLLADDTIHDVCYFNHSTNNISYVFCSSRK